MGFMFAGEACLPARDEALVVAAARMAAVGMHYLK